MECADFGFGEWSRAVDPRGQVLGPGHVDITDVEVASEKRPVGADKAEHARDVDVSVGNGLADNVCLSERAVDEARAVTGVDEQSLRARRQHSSVSPQTWSSLIALGIDDKDPPGQITMWSRFARVPGIRRS